jgi:hypothetical protein
VPPGFLGVHLFSYWDHFGRNRDRGIKIGGSGQIKFNLTGTMRIVISLVRLARSREKAGSSSRIRTQESKPEEGLIGKQIGRLL